MNFTPELQLSTTWIIYSRPGTKRLADRYRSTGWGLRTAALIDICFWLDDEYGKPTSGLR